MDSQDKMSLIASALDEGAVQVSKSKTIWSRTVYFLVLKNFIIYWGRETHCQLFAVLLISSIVAYLL